MRWSFFRRAHLVQDDFDAALCDLPRRLRARQARADYVNFQDFAPDFFAVSSLRASARFFLSAKILFIG